MARYRRDLHPVRSEKHEITFTQLAQNASTTQTIVLAQGVKAPTGTTQMHTGSTVPWIYVEFNLNGVDNSSGAQVVHWIIVKNPQGALTFNPLAYDELNKKFIIKRGMEMLPDIPLDSGGTVQTKRIFTIKIPRGYKRMGDNDTIAFMYRSTSASGINICAFFIYKALE